MAAAFNGEQQATLAGESHRILNVRNAGRLDNKGRMAINRPVQNSPGHVIAFVSGQQQVTAQAVGKLLHGRTLQQYLLTLPGKRPNVTADLRQGL